MLVNNAAAAPIIYTEGQNYPSTGTVTCPNGSTVSGIVINFQFTQKNVQGMVSDEFAQLGTIPSSSSSARILVTQGQLSPNEINLEGHLEGSDTMCPSSAQPYSASVSAPCSGVTASGSYATVTIKYVASNGERGTFPGSIVHCQTTLPGTA